MLSSLFFFFFIFIGCWRFTEFMVLSHFLGSKYLEMCFFQTSNFQAVTQLPTWKLKRQFSMPSELMHHKVFRQVKESMWTFSTNIVSSRGECIPASGLGKSTCGSCSWSHKAAVTSQVDSFLPESNPNTAGWGARCLPKEKRLRKRRGESRCVISNSACIHSPNPHPTDIRAICPLLCLCRI